MRKKIKNVLQCVQHNKLTRHGHHAVYLLYYGLALFDDVGAKFWVVVGVFTFHVLETVAGDG